MKKLTFVLALVMAGQQLFAQSVIDRFFEKYEDDRSFTLVSVTPKMFGMFSKLDINTGEGQQFMSVVKKLKGLRILAKEDATDGNKLYKEAAAFLTRDFEELMTVRDKENDLKFLVKENAKGNISELIMLVGGDKEFVAMSLVGDIDLNEISQIAANMNIQGMDNLKKLKKNDKQ